MIAALVMCNSGAWIVNRLSPSTPALVARLAIGFKGADIFVAAIRVAAVVELIGAEKNILAPMRSAKARAKDRKIVLRAGT